VHRDKYAAQIPESERSDMISAYYRLLTHEDDNISLKAAQEWSRWEYSTATLRQDPEAVAKADEDIKWARWVMI
jgi:proline iminopeptidase